MSMEFINRMNVMSERLKHLEAEVRELKAENHDIRNELDSLQVARTAYAEKAVA